MSLRVLGVVAGVLGGLCWVGRWGADLAGSDPGWSSAAHWVGFALIGIALAVAGAGLVSSSAAWLRLIVAVAFPLLVWSVYMVLQGESDGVLLDGVAGLVAIVVSVAVFMMGAGAARGARDEDHRRSRRHGAHAR